MIHIPIKIAWDSDDDELPNLSERIQSISKLQNGNKEPVSSEFPVILSSNSEVSERINQSSLQSKYRRKESVSSVVPVNLSSDSEEEFLKFSEIIRNTPQSKLRAPRPLHFNISSDSEDENISNLTNRFQSISTPISQNRTTIQSIPEFSEGKKNYSPNVLKESNAGFSNKQASQNHIKYKVPILKIAAKNTSDSEDEFLKFSERIRNTPRLKNSVPFSLDASDSQDEEFSNLSSKPLRLWTPKSQNRTLVCDVDYPEKEILISTPSVLKENNAELYNGIAISKSWTSVQRANAEEYSNLFLCKPEVSETFIKSRTCISKQLFSFYNKKVFSSKLPEDIPIKWRNALTRTAGFCRYKYCGGVWSCSIDLSAPLLTAFNRLQDTLIHEMCHAAVFIISKEKKVAHGPLWQVWASRCNLVLPFIKCPTRCHDYKGEYRFWYFCSKCNWRKGCNKRSAKYNNGICKKCKMPVSFEDKRNIKKLTKPMKNY